MRLQRAPQTPLQQQSTGSMASAGLAHAQPYGLMGMEYDAENCPPASFAVAHKASGAPGRGRGVAVVVSLAHQHPRAPPRPQESFYVHSDSMGSRVRSHQVRARHGEGQAWRLAFKARNSSHLPAPPSPQAASTSSILIERPFQRQAGSSSEHPGPRGAPRRKMRTTPRSKSNPPLAARAPSPRAASSAPRPSHSPFVCNPPAHLRRPARRAPEAAGHC